MGGFAPINTIKLYQEAIRRAGRDGLSMRLRLFGFFLLFLNIIMVGVLVILFATGVFEAGLKEHKTLLQNELSHLSQDVYRSFGAISVQAVDYRPTWNAVLRNRTRRHMSLQIIQSCLNSFLTERWQSLSAHLKRQRAAAYLLCWTQR